MTTLKDLTAEKHRQAEQHPFIKILFSGEINPKFYATYLYNLHACYNVIEIYAAMNHLLKDVPSEIRRSPLIFDDYKELWDDENQFPKVLDSTTDYLEHIKLLDEIEAKNILAHIYVRHMGDLAGGQMIAKKVPGSGRMYKFNNPDLLRSKIRQLVTVDLADEANRCFDFAIKSFDEMMAINMPKTLTDLAKYKEEPPIDPEEQQRLDDAMAKAEALLNGADLQSLIADE